MKLISTHYEKLFECYVSRIIEIFYTEEKFYGGSKVEFDGEIITTTEQP